MVIPQWLGGFRRFDGLNALNEARQHAGFTARGDMSRASQAERNALVCQQRVPRWHRHHQHIAPDRQGHDAVAHFIGLRETYVI